MGYQESYVTANDFPKLVEITKGLGQKFFEDRWVEPVLIITLHKDIIVAGETLTEGTKFIYFTGERQYQRNISDLYGSKQPKDTRSWFTEDFPSFEIFADYSTLARREEFKL